MPAPRLKATAPTARGGDLKVHDMLLARVAAFRRWPEAEREGELRRLARRYPDHFEEPPAYVVALVLELPVNEGETPNEAWERFSSELYVGQKVAGQEHAAYPDVLYMSNPAEVPAHAMVDPDFHTDTFYRAERCPDVPA